MYITAFSHCLGHWQYLLSKDMPSPRKSLLFDDMNVRHTCLTMPLKTVFICLSKE